ncbi:MAG: hypothetical protein ACEQSB_00740 [Undibacterium sp.]
MNFIQQFLFEKAFIGGSFKVVERDFEWNLMVRIFSAWISIASISKDEIKKLAKVSLKEVA